MTQTPEELQSALDGAILRMRQLQDQVNRTSAARDHWKALAEKQMRAPRLILTVEQLRMAADFGDPDRVPENADTLMTIEDARSGFGGPGLYAWYTDYPEEGAIPLFDAPDADEASPTKPEGSR